MSSSNQLRADAIVNDLNCQKFFKFLTEPCITTMIYVYYCLYDWQDKSPEKLTDHLQDIPKNHKKTVKKLFTKDQVKFITAMKADPTIMTGFDLPFYYKLIQSGTNSDKIASPNDNVWYASESISVAVLEHLLFLLKDYRNAFNHKNESILELTNSDIGEFSTKLLEILPSIIKKVGTKTNVDPGVTAAKCNEIVIQIEQIRDQHYMLSNDDDKLKKIIKKDLEIRFLGDLDKSFKNELRAYCPPSFLTKQNEMKINFKDLLLCDGNFQVLVVEGEVGYGKTSFIKYISYLSLSGNASEICNLSSYALVLRVVCRSISSRDISLFLEDQLSNSLQLIPLTSSLKKELFRFSILWVVDGYDEATPEFQGFLKSLLTTFPKNHRMIITTRPDCAEELDEILKKINISKIHLSIQCFIEQQISTVAEKYLNDFTDIQNFATFFKNSKQDVKEFMEIPINLNLSLDLWKSDPSIFDGRLTTQKLYEINLQNNLESLVERLQKRTNLKDELNSNVKKWFDNCLCKLAVESIFNLHQLITRSQEYKLLKTASEYRLIGSYCLSTFLDPDETSSEVDYSFRHNIQKEVLACLYLKRCDSDSLKEIAEQEYVSTYLEKIKSNDPFNFLFKCCDSSEYSRILDIFLQVHPSLQRPEYLMNIKIIHENYFDSLKEKIGCWTQALVIPLDIISDVDALETIIQSLSFDIKRIELVITVQYNSQNDVYGRIINILTDYKNLISFRVTLVIEYEHKFSSVIKIFRVEENHNLIKEIIFYSDWEEKAIEDILSLQNMEKVIFCFNAFYKYFNSYLHHLASFTWNNSISSTNPEKLVSNSSCNLLSPVNHASTPTFSTNSPNLLHQFCSVHFVISSISNNITTITNDLLKVNAKFHTVSVDLELECYWNNDGISGLEKDLILKFQSSSIPVKKLKLNLRDIVDDSIMLQFVNSVTLEILEVILLYSGLSKQGQSTVLPTPLQGMKKMFEIWNFNKQSKLEEILFTLKTPDQLNMLYEKLPSNIIDKSTVEIINNSTLSKNEWSDADITIYSDKKFRKINVSSDKSIRLLDTIDSDVYEYMEDITKSLVIDGISNIGNESGEKFNDEDHHILDVAVDYLEEKEVKNFSSFYRKLSDESKEFLKKTYMNVILCLQLWEIDPNVLHGKLIMYNICEALFEKKKYLLVEKSVGENDELIENVDIWFNNLCYIAASIVFKPREFRSFSKSDEFELSELASEIGLIGNDCFLTFMDLKETSDGLEYIFKEYQVEALACHYLQMCNDDELIRIAEEGNRSNYLKKMNVMNIFVNYLCDFCENDQFARIFSVFQRTQHRLQRADYLMEIKIRNETCFFALMKKIGSWDDQSLTIVLLNDDDVNALENLIQPLSIDVKKMNLLIEIRLDTKTDNYKTINKIISDYETLISFQLTLTIERGFKFIPVIQLFRHHGNHKLIQEIVFESFWEETAIKEVSSLENLKMVSFNDFLPVTQSDYSKSYLANMTSSSSTNDKLGLLHDSCHIHFKPYFGIKPMELMQGLLKVNDKFRSVSVDLDILFRKNEDPNSVIEKQLISNLLSSTIKVKQLKMGIKDIPKDFLRLQLINCLSVEILEVTLYLWKGMSWEPTPLHVLERIFEIWEVNKQINLVEITFLIASSEQLKLIYNELSPIIITKTVVKVFHGKKRPKDDWMSINIPHFTGKQFKRVEISGKNRPPPFTDVETIKSLTAISIAINL